MTAGTMLQSLQNYIWAWMIQAILTLILVTRAATQIWNAYRTPNSEFGTRAISRLPYWIPYFGTTPLFSFRSQTWLLSQSRAYQSGVFALHLSGRDYVVITSPDVQALLSDPTTPVSTRLRDDLRSRRFFNNPQVMDSTAARISKAVLTCTNDKSRTTKLTRLLESQAYNFISPSKSWVDQAQWERSADVTIISDTPLSVSASLPTLIRDFSAYIMISALLGTSFAEANPGFIGDFFTFSNKYATFMTGLPYWLAPGLGPPALARERCLLTLDGLVEAIIADIGGKSMQGTGVGMLYDLDDVNPAIWDLIRQAKSEGGHKKVRAISSEVLEIIWHITFSSVNAVIWMLLYLSFDSDSNKIALQSIREELKSVVEVVKPKPTGLPFEDPPRLNFSSDLTSKLAEKCPVLSGALLEVQRLETEPEEYLVVTSDFVLQSELAGAGQAKFQLKEGDHIYAAYGATNKDTQHWDRPRRFAPNRFISKREGGAKEEVVGRLPKIRSVGHSVLHAEVLCITAALLAFYEIKSLDDGGLKHPGANIVAGVGSPKNINGIISRRTIL